MRRRQARTVGSAAPRQREILMNGSIEEGKMVVRRGIREPSRTSEGRVKHRDRGVLVNPHG